MKVTKIFVVAASCMALTSCFKDELPNMECDIQKAVVHVGNPEAIFYQLSDTIAPINPDFGSSTIQFQNVRKAAAAKLYLAPEFTISEGAMMFPPSGMLRDFSNDTTQIYFVVAEDTKENYPAPRDLSDVASVVAYMQKLAVAAAAGEHIRPYYVQFKTATHIVSDTLKYDFENYFLETQARKYYEWSDPYEDGTARTVPNWATANKGFSTARGSASPEEYPTVPAIGEGVDGTDGVKLETSNTGSFGKLFNMPLAAGNLFLGTFDFSVALTKTLQATRFGDNSTLEKKPVKFTGYYKYAPGPQMTDAKGNNIDGTDVPAIYCVVYKNHNADGSSFVLNGETVDSDTEHIIARAQITDWEYNTSDYVYFELDFNWTQEFDETLLAQKGYSFAIVCSSSSKGATYTGALGSKLYVDKFRLVLESEE